MQYQVIDPEIVEATQFNKIGDHCNVHSGYYRLEAPLKLIVSTVIPRSIGVIGCNILVNPEYLVPNQIINLGDWIVNKLGKTKLKVYSNKKFIKKFTYSESQEHKANNE